MTTGYRHLTILWRQMVHADSEQSRYFLACCRIRGITPAQLMIRLMQHITTDQLVESILDDHDNKRDLPGERDRTSRGS